MSDYRGPDRRSTPEFYTVVCHPRLVTIEQNQRDMNKSLVEVRERIFNGLSDLPESVKWLRRLLVGVLVTLATGFGLLYFQSARSSIELNENLKEVGYELEADRLPVRQSVAEVGMLPDERGLWGH